MRKQYSKTTEETLVAFHVGRGGRFYNSGFVTFIGQDEPISNYTDDLFEGYEEQDSIFNKYRKYPNIFNLILDVTTDGTFEKLSRIGLNEADFGEKQYFTAGGNTTGLAVDNDGTGCINIDNDYDTTYVQLLKDCSESEFEKILNSNSYVSEDVKQYCKEALGIEEEVKTRTKNKRC